MHLLHFELYHIYLHAPLNSPTRLYAEETHNVCLFIVFPISPCSKISTIRKLIRINQKLKIIRINAILETIQFLHKLSSKFEEGKITIWEPKRVLFISLLNYSHI